LFRKSYALAILLLFAFTCGGCITASLATIGTALGALGSAASTGVDVYKLGKLDTALMCNAGECHTAVEKSAVDLHLRVRRETLDYRTSPVYEMTLTDDLNSPVGIRIEQRTPTLCLCRVDVGIFGSEPTARLVMERIRAHLHQTAATNP
jgi:Protein of unknown function (DUF3568)